MSSLTQIRNDSITFRIPNTAKDLIAEAADMESLKVSDICRRATIEYARFIKERVNAHRPPQWAVR